MPAFTQSYPSLAGLLAEDLLKAWLTGDAVRLRTELERSATVPVEARDTGEQERRHLLQAVATRMRRCPNLFDPRSQTPELDLYAHLLWHMVASGLSRHGLQLQQDECLPITVPHPFPAVHTK